MDLHFDCETQDPDDILTLAIAATHPEVNLIGVTVTPGGKDQIGLVKHVLARLGKSDILVGGDRSRETPSVSAFHDKWLGRHVSDMHVTAKFLLMANSEIDSSSNTTLLTGGPLKNVKGIVVPPEYVDDVLESRRLGACFDLRRCREFEAEHGL